jgi:hypothetical protein
MVVLPPGELDSLISIRNTEFSQQQVLYLSSQDHVCLFEPLGYEEDFGKMSCQDSSVGSPQNP